MTYVIEVKSGSVGVYQKHGDTKTLVAKFFTSKAIMYAKKFINDLK